MQRRRFFSTALGLSAALLLPLRDVMAHTPYRQWDIFRKRYLQILSSHSDLDGDAMADAWVARLRDHLPLSNAMVSRARDVARVASLLKTNQAKLAVLSHAHARAMYEASAPFEDYRPMPLQVMIDNGSHLLVARDDLPLHHGYALTGALLEEASALHVRVPVDGMFGMAVHPGARKAALGEAIDPPPAA